MTIINLETSQSSSASFEYDWSFFSESLLSIHLSAQGLSCLSPVEISKALSKLFENELWHLDIGKQYPNQDRENKGKNDP